MATNGSQRIGANNHKTLEVAIASGASVSATADMGGGVLVGWLNPSTLTNTAFDVQASIDGTNYYPITALKSIAANTDEFSAVAPQDALVGWNIRLKGASNEGGARTITLIYRPIA